MAEELVETIKCPRCGQNKVPHKTNRHLCVDCVNTENSRYSHLRMHQENWPEVAREAGIQMWERQPGETQWEYSVWLAYRDSYPGKKPDYATVAQQLNTTYESVRKVARRWTFQARMQAWIAETDRITMEQRRSEIIGMNAEHINMAQRLRDKLSAAIDMIDPTILKPSEIATLVKLSAELESKARVDTIAQDELRKELLVDHENPDIKKSPTKQSDLGEVVQILLKAGALGDITQIGVRRTETTEVVVKDADGQASGIKLGGE